MRKITFWDSLKKQLSLKVSQRVANNQFIDEKASLQQFVILSIILGVSPTYRQPE